MPDAQPSAHVTVSIQGSRRRGWSRNMSSSQANTLANSHRRTFRFSSPDFSLHGLGIVTHLQRDIVQQEPFDVTHPARS